MKKLFTMILAIVFMNLAGLSASAALAEMQTELSTETLSGCYDMIVYEQDDYCEVESAMTLVLTPRGEGRLSDGAGNSVCFRYTVQDGQITTNAEHSLQLRADGNGRLAFLYVKYGVTFSYLRRADIEEDLKPVGSWKLDSIAYDGMTFSGATLDMMGISIEMILYKSGAADWFAKTDSKTSTAQSWSLNGGRYLFYNGDETAMMSVEDDVLTMTSYNSTMTFVRQ